jgi:hypothetical protein
MPDIEQRLKALEKRARADTERQHAVSGEIKAIVSIVYSIFVAVCAGNPARARAIIENIKILEAVAREQNEQTQMLVRLRYEREAFQRRLEKIERGSSGANNGAPRRRK